MVKTDDMNTPEKHEPDEFSPPDEYIAGGERDGEPRGYSLSSTTTTAIHGTTMMNTAAKKTSMTKRKIT